MAILFKISIDYNKKFSLRLKCLATNAVVVKRVHCIKVNRYTYRGSNSTILASPFSRGHFLKEKNLLL